MSPVGSTFLFLTSKMKWLRFRLPTSCTRISAISFSVVNNFYVSSVEKMLKCNLHSSHQKVINNSQAEGCQTMSIQKTTKTNTGILSRSIFSKTCSPRKMCQRNETMGKNQPISFKGCVNISGMCVASTVHFRVTSSWGLHFP